MGKLQSELTWSFSRDRLFKECCRAYFYHYYASWGGWEKDADSFSRKAYILKNIRNIDAWVGDIVHQIIKWILESVSMKKGLARKAISLQEARGKAKQLLTKTWEQSRGKAWEDNVKNNLNLFEHYYGCELTREDLARRLEKVTKSINSFYNSGLIESVSRLEEDKFLRIDELDNFDFEGIKVFAIPDFALRNDNFVLYDWKTGKATDKDILQLSCYALYAVNKWKAEPDRIKIIPVYLTQERIPFKPIEALKIDGVKTYIRESIDAMKLILSDISKNKADINKCPKTDNTWRCRNCKFQEICQ